MHNTCANPVFDYVKSPDQDASQPAHHPVIVVGAGPAGLSVAIDLALKGVRSVLLDDNNTVSSGSRAICFARRTLEILDRYGIGDQLLARGITWNVGKVFFREQLVYEFNLSPEGGHRMPAFINLQQYYLEQYLVERIAGLPQIDLRWLHRVRSVNATPDATSLSVATPDGVYCLSCDYLIVADGANSGVRAGLGLQSSGQVFSDRFLISDVVMETDFPSERWFWFDPPFHPGQSALLHKQADNVWRIDLQLGADADPQREQEERVIRARLQAMLGKDTRFQLEWTSVYTFQCRKMDSFIHHDVIFLGDAAHQVSPFGARGANGGIQAAENLAWKLALVLAGKASKTLLATYDSERQQAAAENILHSTRATDFITPKNDMSRIFRDATLKLACSYRFARPLVNSGRLSAPCAYRDSPLCSPDQHRFNTAMKPGAVCPDAPLRIIDRQDGSWLLNEVAGDFALVAAGHDSAAANATLLRLLSSLGAKLDLRVLLILAGDHGAGSLAGSGRCVVAIDQEGRFHARYDAKPATIYLVRPDQVIAARWRGIDESRISRALDRARGSGNRI